MRAGPGGGARGREVVWSCLIGTSRAQDGAGDAGCGVCVCEGLGVDNGDSMCRPRPCHGRGPATLHPLHRRLLLLRLCIPSGFLVVFEKPTRSSCTSTFTCSKDTAPAMADTSPSSFPKFSAENLSGADQKGGVIVRVVDGDVRGTRDSGVVAHAHALGFTQAVRPPLRVDCKGCACTCVLRARVCVPASS